MDLFTGVSIAFILVYLVVALYVSLSHRTLDEFYVMGRNASSLLVTGTLIATAYSSVTLIGYTGLAFSIGPLPYVSLFAGTMIWVRLPWSDVHGACRMTSAGALPKALRRGRSVACGGGAPAFVSFDSVH